MILIMGPAGAGKSIQGKMLVEAGNYEWISVGALLRDATLDDEIKEKMHHGELLDASIVQNLVAQAITGSDNPDKIILDGFPRKLDQAQWLIDYCRDNNIKLDHVIHLQVDFDIARQRLIDRGRTDDYEDAINKRFGEYKSETLPTIDLFESNEIPVHHINGDLDINEVHNQIVKDLGDVHQS